MKIIPGETKNHTGNFLIVKKIETLQEFREVLESDRSIFWRFKVMPTAFFWSWQFRQIDSAINGGHFYKVMQIKGFKKQK